MTLAARLAVYGLSGWCFEVAFTGARSLLAGDLAMSATTHLWAFALYAGGGFVMERVRGRVRTSTKWAVLFSKSGWPLAKTGETWKAELQTMAMILLLTIMAYEAVVGLLLKGALGRCPWEYEEGATLAGFVRLDYAPAWLMVAFIFEGFARHVLDESER